MPRTPWFGARRVAGPLLALALLAVPLAGASRPAIAGVGATAEAEPGRLSLEDSSPKAHGGEAYSAKLQRLMDAVHDTIEHGLNRSYTTAVKEERKYRKLFARLREGLDNFSRSTRALEAQIPEDRLRELSSIEDALAAGAAPAVLHPMQAASSAKAVNVAAALPHGTGTAAAASESLVMAAESAAPAAAAAARGGAVPESETLEELEALGA